MSSAPSICVAVTTSSPTKRVTACRHGQAVRRSSGRRRIPPTTRRGPVEVADVHRRGKSDIGCSETVIRRRTRPCRLGTAGRPRNRPGRGPRAIDFANPNEYSSSRSRWRRIRSAWSSTIVAATTLGVRDHCSSSPKSANIRDCSSSSSRCICNLAAFVGQVADRRRGCRGGCSRRARRRAPAPTRAARPVSR